MTYYPCPNCEQELQSLISFDNLVDQYNKDKILRCPHCGIKIKLDYDENIDDDGFEEDSWSFRIVKEKNK